ncbi:MAG: bifunctional diaminohydroxyphosphoribosylaminopyrimidine deaminase/5-amino-6-(5-phosphoribosylamino)uracil reductase RibD [Cyanobacteria bacterium P01_E01_bin.34]
MDATQAANIDRYWIQHCLDLARKAAGQTTPNPMVGSVIVRNGRCVGRGFHPKPGDPHAEVFALREAGELAKGATLYVNLEPCNHTGRTPPCSEAVIQAGISRVVAGMVDPNPLVAGSGVERLRQAGIDVTVGVEEEACQILNEAFIHSILNQQPLGILKYAMTLDGKIATTTGHSQWISSVESRTLVHAQRAISDAVVVGGNTVRLDDPQLTCRLADGRNPLRVVLSRRLNLPTTLQLWNTQDAPTLVMTEPASGSKQRERSYLLDFLTAKGVEVLTMPKLTPLTASQALYERGLITVLWECGATVAAAALRDGVIQKVMAFVAPKLVGGITAPGPIAGPGVVEMSSALQLERVRERKAGRDRLIEGYITQPYLVKE